MCLQLHFFLLLCAYLTIYKVQLLHYQSIKSSGLRYNRYIWYDRNYKSVFTFKLEGNVYCYSKFVAVGLYTHTRRLYFNTAIFNWLPLQYSVTNVFTWNNKTLKLDTDRIRKKKKKYKFGVKSECVEHFYCKFISKRKQYI